MRRSTLLAVGVTVFVLIVAGNLPRLPGRDLVRAWSAPAVHALSGRSVLALRPPAAARPAEPAFHLAMGARPSLGWARPRTATRRPSAAVEAGLFAIVGAAAGLGLLALLALSLRRDPRSRVFHLASSGAPMSRIARDSHMAQDAVRTLLVPGLGTRRS